MIWVWDWIFLNLFMNIIIFSCINPRQWWSALITSIDSLGTRLWKAKGTSTLKIWTGWRVNWINNYELLNTVFSLSKLRSTVGIWTGIIEIVECQVLIVIELLRCLRRLKRYSKSSIVYKTWFQKLLKKRILWTFIVSHNLLKNILELRTCRFSIHGKIYISTGTIKTLFIDTSRTVRRVVPKAALCRSKSPCQTGSIQCWHLPSWSHVVRSGSSMLGISGLSFVKFLDVVL